MKRTLHFSNVPGRSEAKFDATNTRDLDVLHRRQTHILDHTYDVNYRQVDKKEKCSTNFNHNERQTRPMYKEVDPDQPVTVLEPTTTALSQTVHPRNIRFSKAERQLGEPQINYDHRSEEQKKEDEREAKRQKMALRVVKSSLMTGEIDICESPTTAFDRMGEELKEVQKKKNKNRWRCPLALSAGKDGGPSPATLHDKEVAEKKAEEARLQAQRDAKAAQEREELLRAAEQKKKLEKEMAAAAASAEGGSAVVDDEEEKTEKPLLTTTHDGWSPKRYTYDRKQKLNELAKAKVEGERSLASSSVFAGANTTTEPTSPQSAQTVTKVEDPAQQKPKNATEKKQKKPQNTFGAGGNSPGGSKLTHKEISNRIEQYERKMADEALGLFSSNSNPVAPGGSVVVGEKPFGGHPDHAPDIGSYVGRKAPVIGCIQPGVNVPREDDMAHHSTILDTDKGYKLLNDRHQPRTSLKVAGRAGPLTQSRVALREYAAQTLSHNNVKKIAQRWAKQCEHVELRRIQREKDKAEVVHRFRTTKPGSQDEEFIKDLCRKDLKQYDAEAMDEETNLNEYEYLGKLGADFIRSIDFARDNAEFVYKGEPPKGTRLTRDMYLATDRLPGSAVASLGSEPHFEAFLKHRDADEKREQQALRAVGAVTPPAKLAVETLSETAKEKRKKGLSLPPIPASRTPEPSSHQHAAATQPLVPRQVLDNHAATFGATKLDSYGVATRRHMAQEKTRKERTLLPKDRSEARRVELSAIESPMADSDHAPPPAATSVLIDAPSSVDMQSPSSSSTRKKSKAGTVSMEAADKPPVDSNAKLLAEFLFLSEGSIVDMDRSAIQRKLEAAKRKEQLQQKA